MVYDEPNPQPCEAYIYLGFEKQTHLFITNPSFERKKNNVKGVIFG